MCPSTDAHEVFASISYFVLHFSIPVNINKSKPPSNPHASVASNLTDFRDAREILSRCLRARLAASTLLTDNVALNMKTGLFQASSAELETREFIDAVLSQEKTSLVWHFPPNLSTRSVLWEQHGGKCRHFMPVMVRAFIQRGIYTVYG